MPVPDRVAVLSDVHGNLTAYEAALADIRARGITRIINLGDQVGKGRRGSECVRLTQQHCEVTVQGNWEAFITGAADEVDALGEAVRWWRAELRPDQVDCRPG